MSSMAVQLRGVKKRFADFSLDIDEFELERGFVLGVIGQNGAGKSTTIKIILNLVYPDAGEVNVLGLKQPDASVEIKQRVGYVSESPVFYDAMTIGWTANLVKRYHPTWDDDYFAGYLEKFGLRPEKRVGSLSKGMRAKLALALALAHRAELLLLDEPTLGIDPVVKRELLQEISDIIRDENRAVLFSSHITSDVDSIADYIAILEQGQVVEHRKKETLLDRWRKVSGVMTAPAAALRPKFRTMTTDGERMVGITDSFSEDWLRETRSLGLEDSRVHRMNLDDILVTVVGKEL